MLEFSFSPAQAFNPTIPCCCWSRSLRSFPSACLQAWQPVTLPPLDGGHLLELCGGRQRAQHSGLGRLHILYGWRSFLKNWWTVCRAAEVHRWGCGRQGDWPPSCSASKAQLETARQSVICLHGKHRVAGNALTRSTLITLAWQTIIWDSVTSVHTACPVSSLRQFRYPGEHWLFFFF